MRLIGNNTGIEVPPEVVEALGAGKRPAVNVTVNGFEYRSTVAVMGGRSLHRRSAPTSGRRPASRAAIRSRSTLTLDTAPRTVEVPDDLAAALAAAGLREAFDALSPSARKAHVTNVESREGRRDARPSRRRPSWRSSGLTSAAPPVKRLRGPLRSASSCRSRRAAAGASAPQ